MPGSIQKIASGFLSGTMAAFLFHQAALFALAISGILPDARAWSWAPGPHPLLPAIVMTCLWGGFWGTIIAMAWEDMPGDSIAMRGIVAGLLGPGLIGSWTIVPWLTNQPLFADGNVKQIAISSVLLACYGVGVAIFLVLFEKREAQRPERRRVLI